jgi:hypothetical protein
MRALLDEQSVINANAQFWEQMLAIKLEPVPMAEIFCVGTRHLLGTVELSGVWKGRIEVRIDEKLAYLATAAMLMQSGGHSRRSGYHGRHQRDHQHDCGCPQVLSLPRPCSMTVPESMVEPERICESQRTESTLAVGFRHAEGDLMVRVWEHEAPQQ